ncbi:MFS transporter [Catellatospora sp. NPDC049609]|uniref:MFS transporter n=1 Tax=Catellatospora sp. NPDC049609 TaxID=3155505 RepID=UPI0034297AD1
MKALAGLLAAGTISVVGSRMTFLAVPWLVLVTTGSPTKMGVAAAAEMLPYVLAGPLGAPLVDRLGARRVSIAADLASVAVMAAVAFGQAGGFGLLVVLLVLAGVLRGLGDCAKRVLLPVTIRACGVEMTRATSLYDGLNRLASLLAAGLGGVLIAWLGARQAVLLDAATFAVCAALLWTLLPGDERAGAGAADGAGPDAGRAPGTGGRRPADHDETGAVEVREPYWQALRGGFAYLRGDRLMIGIVVLLFVTNLVDQANAVVFIPLWVNEVLGSPVALGWVHASFSLGAVLGNVVFTTLAPRAPRYAVFTIGFLIAGAPRMVVMALAGDLAPVLAAVFAAGLAIAAVNPILSAVSFERVPAALQARVVSLTGAVAYAGIPLGGLLGGWWVQAFDLTTTLLVFAAAYLGATLLPVFFRTTWRQLDHRPTAAPTTVPAQGAEPIPVNLG